jgi:hypothetical protein
VNLFLTSFPLAGNLSLYEEKEEEGFRTSRNDKREQLEIPETGSISMKKDTKPLPSAPKAWLKEIATAYLDAEEAIPFGPMAGVTITKKDLFHLAPAVCLKFRGLEQKKNIKKVTEAALSSYVATLDTAPDSMADPHMAFAFCYIASHFGMGLVTDEEATGLLEYVEKHLEELRRMMLSGGPW